MLVVGLGLMFLVFHGAEGGSREAFVPEMSRKPLPCSLLNESGNSAVTLVRAKEVPSLACMRDCCKGSFKLSSRYLLGAFTSHQGWN